MESLETVLQRRRRELVDVLVSGTSFSIPSAERFVAVAGSDLVQAIAWKNDGLAAECLSEPANVRDVLSTMEAGQIASTLGMSRSEVWPALRAFVPRALELADPCLDA